MGIRTKLIASVLVGSAALATAIPAQAQNYSQSRDWQNDRYESSRAKKQQLDLRLLYLQMQKEDGMSDPTVTREISDLQARIEKYDRYLREVEESIEERR